MRFIPFLAALLLAAVAFPSSYAAEGATVRAILFIASNEKGPSDPKLASYEPTLRRVLRFESYRYAGQSSTSVSAGGTARINLQGQTIEVENENGRIRVTWNDTAVNVPPGKPAVLLGKSNPQGGVDGIIVTAN